MEEENLLETLNMKTIIVTLVGAVVLVMIVLILFDAMSIGTVEIEYFDVTDSSVDNVNTLTNDPAGGVTVEQYTGSGWESVSSTHVTVAGKDVTVAAAGMY